MNQIMIHSAFHVLSGASEVNVKDYSQRKGTNGMVSSSRSQVHTAEVKKRFDSFDKDRSGLIDYNEFLLMLAQLLKAKSVRN